MSGQIAVIGIGEVGSGIVRALVAGGFDVVAHDARPAQARARLAGIGIDAGRVELAELAEAAARPQVVSCVVPAAAVGLLEDLRELGVGRGAYLDINSTGPAEKLRMGAIAAEAGYGSFTDGTIGGGGFRLRGGPVFHLAGSGAGEWASVLARAGFRTDVLGGSDADVGRAATFKMVRSAFTKGYEALIAESLAVAAASDLLEPIVASIGDTFDALPFSEQADLLVRGHVSHAARRLDEVRMAKATVAPLVAGDDLPMIEATEHRFAISSSRLGDRYSKDEPHDLASALALLTPRKLEEEDASCP